MKELVNYRSDYRDWKSSGMDKEQAHYFARQYGEYSTEVADYANEREQENERQARVDLEYLAAGADAKEKLTAF